MFEPEKMLCYNITFRYVKLNTNNKNLYLIIFKKISEFAFFILTGLLVIGINGSSRARCSEKQRKMKMIEIKNNYNGMVLHTVDADTLVGADLRGLDLGFADLRGANLLDADLRGANLRGADLRNANLRFADLRNANLRGADLSRADLSRADLRGANLSGADLSRADLSRADLSRADLSDADLRGANLFGANLRGAIVSEGYVVSEESKFHHLTGVGSENGTLELYKCNAGWFIKRGCFGGSVKEFLAAVAEKHGDNEHGRKYRGLVETLCV